MTITFALSHQIISRTDNMVLASGSKNYVTAKFELLTEDWTAPITAIFNEYTVVLDGDNQCLVPWEVLANPGKVEVSAFCGDLHTATSVLVPVHPGGYIDGQTPQPPSPDVYAQLTQMVQTALDTVGVATEEAAASAAAASGKAQEATAAAEMATRKAEEAAASAASAKASSANAAASQEAAAVSASTASSKAVEATTAAETATDQAAAAASSATAAKASETSAAGSADSAAQSAKKAEDAAKSVPLIDDTTVSPDHPWSSQKIAETFCPPFKVSGPVVSCNPLVNSPLHVVSKIVPVQDGTGDPNPENVRPIHGWDSAKLWHGGSNLFDISKVSETNVIKNNGDSLTLLPTGIAVQTKETLGVICPGLKAGNSYTISATTTGLEQIHIIETGKKWTFGNPVVITEEDLKSTIYFYTKDAGTSATISKIMINIGQTASPYEPFRGNTITLPFGQTIYGGTLDWNTGVLTIDHFGRTYTHLDSFYSYSSNGVFSFATKLLDFKEKLNPITTKWMCDTLIPESYNYAGANKKNYSVGTDSGSGALYFRLDNNQEATVEDFKTWIGQHPTTVVADLRTPFSIQLTPTEILALSGVNTLYTDTGDTTVSGLADPIQVIQKLTERISALEQNAIGG